jgi:hypothetical protein
VAILVSVSLSDTISFCHCSKLVLIVSSNFLFSSIHSSIAFHKLVLTPVVVSVVTVEEEDCVHQFAGLVQLVQLISLTQGIIQVPISPVGLAGLFIVDTFTQGIHTCHSS